MAIPKDAVYLIIPAAMILATAMVAEAAHADTVSTGFEGLGSGTFTVGTPPVSATFAGGNAQTVGNPAFYHSGAFSWHVSAGSTATITFETPARSIGLWYRDTPGGAGEVRAIDTGGVVLASGSGSSVFQHFVVSRAAGETLIARAEFVNTGTADIVMDDVMYTADAFAAERLDDPIPAAIPTGSIEIQLVEVLAGLVAPVFASNSPNDSTTLYVVDQPGRIIAVDLASSNQSTFLDVSSLLVPLGAFGVGSFDERGLLGLAFHPNFEINGLLYTYTSQPVVGEADYSTMPDGMLANHQSVITEWHTTDPGNPAVSVKLSTGRELLRVDQPQFNHNAGALAFDSNNYLYIAFGDGGGADDLDGQDFIGSAIVGHGTGNGQDPSNPLGAVLRIDPEGSNSPNTRYGIPTSNPFVGPARAGHLEEIFAYGFRNPFRMSFDRATGDLWIADVGQNDIEEINVVTAGNNYGWNLKEGSFFFDPNSNDEGFVTATDPGVAAGLVDPVAEYDHDEGIAIIGGFVYNGARSIELQGRYVFGDFGAFGGSGGRIFYLDGSSAVQEFQLAGLTELNASVNGFGIDGNGEIYLLTNRTGTPFGTTGTVYLLETVTPAEDADQDGVADDADAFPNDPAASVDTDGDGMPDEYNASASPEQIAASTLVVDLDDDNDGVSDADENAQERNPKLNEAAALVPLLNVILD